MKNMMFPAGLVLCVCVFSSGCGKNLTDPTDQEVPQVGLFVFTLDSQKYTTPAAGTIDTAGRVAIAGQTLIGGVSVTVGLYLNANTSPNSPITLGDPFAGAGGGAMIIYGDMGNPSQVYETLTQGATGEARLVSKSNTQISGTCSFTAKQIVGGTGQKVLTGGAFNVMISPFKVPAKEKVMNRMQVIRVDG